MSIWQVLEIEATTDKKTIKRAYAKKLKLCRPDSDPEGFQQLHAAYKAALDWQESYDQADYRGVDDDDFSKGGVFEASFESSSEFLLEPAVENSSSSTARSPIEPPVEPPIAPDPLAHVEPVDYAQTDFDGELAVPEVNSDADALFDEKIEALINDESQFFRIKEWRKLLESEKAREVLADLSYKQNVSTWLFGWGLYRQSQDPPLSRHLLRYFAELFQWQNYQKRLDARFGFGIVAQMLEHIDETAVIAVKSQTSTHAEPPVDDFIVESLPAASLLKRVSSAAVDMVNAIFIGLMFIFVTRLVVQLAFSPRSDDLLALVGIVGLFVMLARFLFLASKNPSRGQDRFALVVVDKHGVLASASTLKLRCLLLLLQIFLLAFALPANLICYFFTRQFIHDIISGVVVIDAEKVIADNADRVEM